MQTIKVPDLAELADRWHRMRAAKGMTAERANREMRDPIRQATMRSSSGRPTAPLATRSGSTSAA